MASEEVEIVVSMTLPFYLPGELFGISERRKAKRQSSYFYQMKTTTLYLMALLCIALQFSTASCKKGDNGPVGQNGATILSGTGVPAISVGKNGDFYLDLSTMQLYGPKTDAGWGSGVQLKGNANVNIDTFTIKQTDWLYSAVYWTDISTGSSEGYVSKYYEHQQSLLTQDLLNTGMVTVSAITSLSVSPNTYTTLPFSFPDNLALNFSYNYAYTTVISKLRIYFYFTKTSDGTSPAIATYTPPAVKIKLAMVSGTIVQDAGKVIRQRSGARFVQ